MGDDAEKEGDNDLSLTCCGDKRGIAEGDRGDSGILLCRFGMLRRMLLTECLKTIRKREEWMRFYV
jgi:hypothetical protein